MGRQLVSAKGQLAQNGSNNAGALKTIEPIRSNFVQAGSGTGSSQGSGTGYKRGAGHACDEVHIGVKALSHASPILTGAANTLLDWFH